MFCFMEDFISLNSNDLIFGSLVAGSKPTFYVGKDLKNHYIMCYYQGIPYAAVNKYFHLKG